jgi:purine-binding chemotaxis protein CheW
MDAPQADGSRSAGVRAGDRQLVGFRLAEQPYAFRIEQIREIVIPSAVTGMPEVPAFVEGVTNLRGTIIPIVSLRGLFGLDRRPIDAETRTIVCQVGPRIMGCTVDSVSRVMRVTADHIQPAPDAVVASGRAFIEGFVRTGDELFILLDVERLLDPAHLDEVHRASTAHLPDHHPPDGAA